MRWVQQTRADTETRSSAAPLSFSPSVLLLHPRPAGQTGLCHPSSGLRRKWRSSYHRSGLPLVSSWSFYPRPCRGGSSLSTDFPQPRSLLQLLREVLPGQRRHTVSPACPGSSSGPPQRSSEPPQPTPLTCPPFCRGFLVFLRSDATRFCCPSSQKGFGARLTPLFMAPPPGREASQHRLNLLRVLRVVKPR